MDTKTGVAVKGLSQHEVHSAEDVLKQLQTAQTQRMVGETKMNKQVREEGTPTRRIV
jgi:hypothetical protein